MTQHLTIQGGMGVAVSGWPLTRAVWRLGQLGVVSGVALAVGLANLAQFLPPGLRFLLPSSST